MDSDNRFQIDWQEIRSLKIRLQQKRGGTKTVETKAKAGHVKNLEYMSYDPSGFHLCWELILCHSAPYPKTTRR